MTSYLNKNAYFYLTYDEKTVLRTMLKYSIVAQKSQYIIYAFISLIPLYSNFFLLQNKQNNHHISTEAY